MREKRGAFIKDESLSRGGFNSFDEAMQAASLIPDTDSCRVRVRWRNRTQQWDLVVKRRQGA